MIYHGSTIPDLKVIKARESTQKGTYVYGTPNMITAAIFAIAQKTGKPYSPKLKLEPGHQSIAERFENQFASLENMKISIYIMDEKNFKPFEDETSGHSAGNDIELRAEDSQKVKGEIKIDNVLEFLKNNGVTFYEYKDREKIGIPKTDKYFVQGALNTYLWKIEGRTNEDLIRGEIYLNQFKENFPQYNELVDSLKNMILLLSEEKSKEFVKKFYNKDKDCFDNEFILKTQEDLNLTCPEKNINKKH